MVQLSESVISYATDGIVIYILSISGWKQYTIMKSKCLNSDVINSKTSDIGNRGPGLG